MASLKERAIGIPQFLAIILVAVLVFLGWDFVHRVQNTMDLLQKDSQAEVRLNSATEINQQLKQMKDQVTGDAWVERYARNKWHWDREGDVAVVPIAPSTQSAAGPTLPAPTPAPPSKPQWQSWLDRLISAIFGPPS